jgi:RNA polymerase sigma-70 factor (ECF subfamily)
MSVPVVQLNLSALPDWDLAERMRGGDQRAFELVMRRHNRLLYRTARAILRDDAEAEDCVQEAYLQGFRSIAAFRGESKLSTWLTRIVVNQALGTMRKRKKQDSDISLDNVLDLDGHVRGASASVGEPEQPEASALREEMRRILERNIDQLPSAFRTVFMLRALEEMSAQETAECLGIPEATVRTRFFRARSLLRESLEKDVDVALEGAFAFDGARCDRIVQAVLDRLRRLTGPSG